MSGLAFQLDHAVVLRDEVLRQRKSQAGAAFASRDEREKYLFADLFGYAGTIVQHLNDHDEAMELAGRPGVLKVLLTMD